MREPKESIFKNSTHEILDVNGFPFRECRRCEGTGVYSFNLLTGNTCFNCRGGGAEIAPRAKKAFVAWRAHLKGQREATPKNLNVGDEILHNKTWRVIKSITQTDKPCGWRKENNGPEIVTDWWYVLEFVDGTVLESNSCLYRRRAQNLDPTSFLAMIKPLKAVKV